VGSKPDIVVRVQGPDHPPAKARAIRDFDTNGSLETKNKDKSAVQPHYHEGSSIDKEVKLRWEGVVEKVCVLLYISSAVILSLYLYVSAGRYLGAVPLIGVTVCTTADPDRASRLLVAIPFVFGVSN